jgi:hypothetical protein
MKRARVVLFLVFGAGAIAPHHAARLEKIGPHCLTLFAQDQQLPGPGNPGHNPPAPGATCVHNEKDPAHNCLCHRECKQNTDDDGNPTAGGYVQEDPKCRVYCYKDHCHCPIENCD